LKYSAIHPVDSALLHRLSIDNDTLSQLDFHKYGNSVPSWIRDIQPKHGLNETYLQVISGIVPNSGTSTTYYSASIPFVANGVALWPSSGNPFIVSHSVSAKLAQPEIVNNIGVNTTK
jgi:hypothetical protein